MMQRVQLPAQADTFSPLPLKINADGSVSYEFEGHILAAGLDLHTNTVVGVPPDDRKVRWIREAGGFETAYIVGVEFGSDPAFLNLVSNQLLLQAIAGSTEYGNVQATAQRGTGIGVDVHVVHIVDDSGRSSFLKLAEGLANRKIAFGSDSITGNGSSSGTGKNINHGLGKTPTHVGINVLNNGLIGNAFSFNTTQFQAWLEPKGAGGFTATIGFTWIAIG